MNLALVLQMAMSGGPERTAVTAAGRSLTVAELGGLTGAAAAEIRQRAASAVLYLGGNTPAYPVALFGAACAGVPMVPLNYRLSRDQLSRLVVDHPDALLVRDRSSLSSAAPDDDLPWHAVVEARDLLDLDPVDDLDAPQDADGVAVLLYTSGTTAAPKAAVLRHRHLLAYLFGTVEFGGADDHEAALVTVPPYHVAGLTNLLSNLYATRRIVYLDGFTPRGWLDTVRAERITQAMVVPTMLARVVEELAGHADAGVSSLRTLSYGGARMPLPVLQRALALFPDTGFVNAYGLTESSSTIALLGPVEHRAALVSPDPKVRARLESVGRPLPGLEVQIRDEHGVELPAGATGLVYVRGEQVSGEYAGATSADDGWFCTRDRGRLDDAGYLFIEGRDDDTIIRAGENIAPAEIEDVLLTHADVVDAVVVGVPDEQWGQRLAAAVVLRPGGTADDEELREWVRARLRSAKTPDVVAVRDELPRTDTGKLLRRVVLQDLLATVAPLEAARH